MHLRRRMWPAAHLRLGAWHVVVSTYGVAVALGVAVGVALAVRRARRPDVMLVVAPLVVLGGFAGSAVWHAAWHASPGVSSMGGVAGGLAVAAVAARVLGVPARALLDALAPGALAGLALGRVGCFLAGCCHGTATALPWGVVVDALGPPARHPVPLYEAAVDAAVAWGAARRRGPAGAASGLALVGYGLGRLLLEAVRDPAASDVARTAPVAPWCAAALVALGLALARGRAAPPDDSAAPAR